MNSTHNLSELLFKEFHRDGYVIVPELLNDEFIQSITSALDNIGTGSFSMLQTIESETLIKLLYYLPIHNILDSLFNQNPYTLHHYTSAIHTTQTPNLGWHHDKVTTFSRGKNNPLMIHCLVYPNGLKREIGQLLLVPKSQQWDVDRYQLSALPFEALVHKSLDYLSPGSVVFINSSLVHARQSLPLIDESSRRYFLDISFCDSRFKWEPYLESIQSWRDLFKQIESSSISKVKINSNILDTSTFSTHLTNKFVPSFLENKSYRFLSFYYRKLLKTTKLSKLEY